MPILPLIDLLILMSTASLVVGFVLKAINLTTHYSPTVLGFSSLDFVLITGVCLGLAVVLAARTWVKLNEPQLRGVRSHPRLQRRPTPLPVDDLVDGEYDEEPASIEAARAEFR